MLALLLTAGMAIAPVPYDTDALHGFVAAASDRIVDGAAYARDGVLSAGALYAHDAGFFARTEFATFRGDGEWLPRGTLLALDTAVGWQWQRASFALLDYRLDGAEDHHDHQGVMLDYRFGGLALEIGAERRRPYYHPRFGFNHYDVRRGAATWQQPLRPGVAWYVGIGTQHIDWRDRRLDYATAGLRAAWLGLEWQVAVVHADGNATAPGDPGTQLLLRLAKPFRID